MLRRSGPGGSLRAVASSFAAISSSSCSFVALIFLHLRPQLYGQSFFFAPARRSVFAWSLTAFMLRLSAALISVHDLPAAIKSRSRFFSSGVHRTLGITQSFSSVQTPALQAGHHCIHKVDRPEVREQ